MTSADLSSKAELVAAAYRDGLAPTAILLVGSVTSGDADEWSDVDLIVYHRALPGVESLANVHRVLGVAAERTVGDEDGFSERFELDGVEVQIGHATVAGWLRARDRVVVDHETDPLLLKVVGGFVSGRSLYGKAEIERWRAGCTYSDELRRAVVVDAWNFFPLWFFEEQLLARDATLWRTDALVDAVRRLLTVVATLNGVFFGPVEPKRVGRLAEAFTEKPADFAKRLESLFELERVAAPLEELVAEVEVLARRRVQGWEPDWRRGRHDVAPGQRLVRRR